MGHWLCIPKFIKLFNVISVPHVNNISYKKMFAFDSEVIFTQIPEKTF